MKPNSGTAQNHTSVTMVIILFYHQMADPRKMKYHFYDFENKTKSQLVLMVSFFTCILLSVIQLTITFTHMSVHHHIILQCIQDI